MTIGIRFRRAEAILLMAAGCLMSLRGVYHCTRHDLGWQNLLLSVVLGGLVFMLGLSRWQFLRKARR